MRGLELRSEVETDKRVARDVNQRMTEVGRALADEGEEPLLDFLCECGCDGRVSLSVLRYENEGGAWIPGHEPGLREVTPAAT